MELEGCRTHSTSAFKPSSASRTTRGEVVRLPIYGRNSKEAVRAPLPATSWVHRAKQAVRKGGSSKDEPKASSVSLDARVSIGAHAHLVPDSPGAHVSPGGHHNPDQRPCPKELVPTSAWRSRLEPFPDVRLDAGALVSLGGHVSSSAHAHLVLMLHSMFKGDRSGTYRARTSGTNPPWQESCSMHDFGAPDAK